MNILIFLDEYLFPLHCNRILFLVLICAVLSNLCAVVGSPFPGPGSKNDGYGRGMDLPIKPSHAWTKKRNKSSECRLGNQRYELYQKWSPDLGPPFGRWACVLCECVPVPQKRRIKARVQCRNIKSECPKITCNNPVLLPGKCCKECLPETQLRPFPGDMPIEDELSGNDFAVLLNGRTSKPPLTTTHLATGRLTLRRGTLHFSFMLAKGVPKPVLVRFQGDDESILEELETQSTPYEEMKNKICGTWTRVPKSYRDLLRNQQMWVALVPATESDIMSDKDDDIISGRISRYSGVETEVFSSLLVPSNPSMGKLSGGGTAILSVSAYSQADSVHVKLVFNGIFSKEIENRGNATINVQLTPVKKDFESVTDKVFVEKTFVDINEASVMTTLGESGLRLLTRGKVVMKIWADEAENLSLEGPITARATCNVYSTVLTESKTSQSVQDVLPFGSGWGLLRISDDGDFIYEIFSKNIIEPITSVSLETYHRKKPRLVDDLTQYYKNEWTNGTYSRPTYSDLDSLLRGRLKVVIKSKDGDLTGSLSPVAITDALRSPTPILLSSPDSYLGATAWISVDNECIMHYDIKIGGESKEDPMWRLEFRENDTMWDPRLEQNVVILETLFHGKELSAHSNTLSKLSLARIKEQVSYLDLKILPIDYNIENTIHASPLAILSGRITGVSVPGHCILNLHDNPKFDERCKDNPHYIGCTLNPRNPTSPTKKCMDDEKKIYENGSGWPSPANNCQKCMCTAGIISCQDEICPPLSCNNPKKIEGQCCRVCPEANGIVVTPDMDKCTIDNKAYYSVGSSWYPFRTPKGFDKCVTCSCVLTDESKSVVQCSKTQCPELLCAPEDYRYREDSCCPYCIPSSKNIKVIPDNGLQGDEPTSIDRRKKILSEGGCLYRGKKIKKNGEEWSPRLSSGYYYCVVCKCKDGSIECNNVKSQCPKLSCAHKVKVSKSCCKECREDKPSRKGSKRKSGKSRKKKH